MEMRKIVLSIFLACSVLFSFAQENTEQSLAFQYYNDGEYEKAAGLLSKLYDKNPSPAIYRYLYNSLLYIKDYEGLEELKSRLSEITFVKTIANPAALTTPINAAKKKNILFQLMVQC